MKKFLSIVAFLFALVSTGTAQTILSNELTSSDIGLNLTQYLEKVKNEDKGSVSIYYLESWLENFKIELKHVGRPFKSVLDDLLQNSEIAYFEMYTDVIVFIKDPSRDIQRSRSRQQALVNVESVKKFSFGQAGVNNNETIKLTGKVRDEDTDSPIPFVSIQVDGGLQGIVTDDQGEFELVLGVGSNILKFVALDYEEDVYDILAYESANLDIGLIKSSIVLDEIIISGEGSEELATSRIGKTRLSLKGIQRSPAFLGEADIVKQVQNLPGVSTVGEAAAGFNVRGGSVDQNLILYDDIPVYNSSHIFGFLSAFNSDAIRDVSFYKGGIPSEYGGRASSVLDIKSRSGSFDKWNGNIGIGMITSSLSINGPIKKDKTSLALSFRSTYSNWLVRAIRTDYTDLSESSVTFYDGTIKLAHRLNDNSRISFTGYASRDGFQLVGDSTYRWHNVLGAIKLDHQFSSDLNADFTLGTSTYGYNILDNNERTASELSFRVTSIIGKANFNYNLNEHKLNFGWQGTSYLFKPGSLEAKSEESNARDFALDQQFAIENAFYVSDGINISNKIYVEGGLRIPLFMAFGEENVNIYGDGAREVSNIIETREFENGEIIKTYVGLEPRLSFRFMTGVTSSVKLGYNRVNQFLHLITNTASITPVDIWQPSNFYFEPQVADQVSLGYSRDFKEKAFGFTTEIYHKRVQNLIDFKDGAQLVLNENLETELLQGNGRSYGIEMSFFRNTGRLTGTLNYTYSRSFREIAGETPLESINNGEEYPTNFDQPHVLNLSWKYNLSKRHYFTGNFTYQTGRPVTVPISAFQLENNGIAFFSSRNEFRIPDYHRLDLALVIEGNHKRTKKWKGRWVFSIYNVYARQNPFTIFFQSSDTGIPRPFQLSIVGTAFPSISYKIEF